MTVRTSSTSPTPNNAIAARVATVSKVPPAPVSAPRPVNVPEGKVKFPPVKVKDRMVVELRKVGLDP